MNKFNISLLLTLTIFLTSCDKSYKYIEKVSEESILGGTHIKEKDETIIKAKDDSTAYLEAFQKFCISVKVNRDMAQSMGKTYSTPISFKLLNNKGEDITKTTLFASRTKRENEIENEIFSMKNSIQDAVDNNKKEKAEKFKQTAKLDSVKIKKLKQFFRVRKDEFSPTRTTWYEPKSAPRYINRNGLYCYFQSENDIPSNLRFRMQYYSDDWLFFRKVQFLIGNKAYEYVPMNTETDNGDGGHIWEWFDESIRESDKELINALANAKSAKMKLIGRQYFDIRNITKEQMKDIKRTLELYQAMGGK
ncbi:hypothetical protein [Pedobacter endophyticus]|uniref:Lipoprotein n=1 Tax=Pedobacter endophyticus TaxID=2789740 RepID=A0A7S9L1A5_9SPHI|nr:hypothetical protein [Pedobacter endophyticus]QPH40660.1 hypothetical protein IZT61_05135 [Pedobacter endophyticus]